MNEDPLDPKLKPENEYKPSDKEIDFVGDVYTDFFNYRNYRSGAFRQFSNKSLEDVLSISRTLFWNATDNASEDLANIGLEFNIPFTRKEVMDFVSRMTALNIKPRIMGDDLESYGVKVLQGLYQKWRFKSNDKVEKFWQLLYGVINGTVCLMVGYNNQKKTESFLKSYDGEAGTFSLDTKDVMYWDDVEVSLVPLEDMYLSKVYERNVQKQGKVIRKTQMQPADFHREFQMYPDHKHVPTGNRIAEDSLYFRLLGGTGITTSDKIEVLRVTDTDNDIYGIVANGILLNKLGKGESMRPSPLPWDHKMQPYVWSISEAVDEKLAYGMPMPFKIRDLHKMSNAQYIMLMERELRLIDPPILSSDLEAPQVIFGAKKVIPVIDVNAYKELDIKPAGADYLTSMNSVQSMMTTLAQGGVNQVVPSIQPKSAAEVDAVNTAKQQAMAVPVLMYYDMLRQEIMLILKTMLQFYSAKKFEKDEDRVLKSLVVPNQNLSQGGVGDLEIRIVRKATDAMELYFEAIRKGIENGRITEIIEAPYELIQNLEFEITDIELEPEQTSQMKKALFSSQFLIPLIQNWGQTGLLDPSKTMLRFMEVNEEHPLDYVSDKAFPQMMASWKSTQTFPPQAGSQGINSGSAAGALSQSPMGQAMGGMSNGGQGMGAGGQGAPNMPQQ